MMHRTALRGAFLAAAALTLAACSGDPAPGANPQSLMPSNNAYTSAFMQTNALGSAHLDLTVTTNLAGQQTIRTATGSISLGGPFGELTWHDTGIRERSNGQGVYLQDPAPDGPWRALPKGDTTDTMPLTQVLWGLGGADVGCADDPSAAGALHCTGTLPVDGDVTLGRGGGPGFERRRRPRTHHDPDRRARTDH